MKETNKKDDIIYLALIARGYSGEKLEQAYKDIKQKGITIDDLIKQFIAKVDANPSSISERNCESGKCSAWEFKK